jgi:hypothetical protein
MNKLFLYIKGKTDNKFYIADSKLKPSNWIKAPQFKYEKIHDIKAALNELSKLNEGLILQLRDTATNKIIFTTKTK